jgi:glycine/D-amino acid oxidase-like deaminating enzyme
MRIAIIGAGLSGLSIAWHLMKSGRCAVTLYDAEKIGAGASGIAAGLMHPYPGEDAKRSFMATEGIAATRALLAVAQQKSLVPLACDQGILRFPQTEQARERLLSHAHIYGDVQQRGSAFWLKDGMTLFSKHYLESLWLALEEQGAVFRQHQVKDLSELAEYDHTVFALGAGIQAFPETASLRLELLKGQVLLCRAPEGFDLPPCSIVGKGYIARTDNARLYLLGSTYERGSKSDKADIEKAKQELLPKIAAFYPDAYGFEILECRAAFRVMRIGHYHPILARLGASTWVCTALGSRGLLYHGLLGEVFSRALLEGEAIPKEFIP